MPGIFLETQINSQLSAMIAANQADIDVFGTANNFDVQHLSPDARKKLVKAWIDDSGYTPDKPNWFKRLISNVRIWFHNHGIKIKHLSDDDIANIILRSAKAARDERRSSVVKDNLTTGDDAQINNPQRKNFYRRKRLIKVLQMDLRKKIIGLRSPM